MTETKRQAEKRRARLAGERFRAAEMLVPSLSIQERAELFFIILRRIEEHERTRAHARGLSPFPHCRLNFSCAHRSKCKRAGICRGETVNDEQQTDKSG